MDTLNIPYKSIRTIIFTREGNFYRYSKAAQVTKTSDVSPPLNLKEPFRLAVPPVIPMLTLTSPEQSFCTTNPMRLSVLVARSVPFHGAAKAVKPEMQPDNLLLAVEVSALPTR